MATFDWMILCEQAGYDDQGRFHMHGFLDQIYTKTMPSTKDMAIVLRLAGGANEVVTLRFDVMAPSRQVLGPDDGTVEAQLDDKGVFQMGVNLPGVPLPECGTYAVRAYLDEREGRSLPFDVTLLQ